MRIEKPIYGGAFLARDEGKAFLFRLRCPANRPACALLRTSAVMRLPKWKRLLRLRPIAQRLPAGILACVAGAITSTRRKPRRSWPFKQAILRETLERAGVAAPERIDVLSAEPWGYRNRIRLALDAEWLSRLPRQTISPYIVPIAECPIAAPLLVRAALAVGLIMRKLAPGARVNEVSLFCDAAETALLASVTVAGTRKRGFEDFAQALAGDVPELKGVELLAEGAKGEPPHSVDRWGANSLVYRAAGMDYRVDHGAFFQVESLACRCAGRAGYGACGAAGWPGIFLPAWVCLRANSQAVLRA